MNPLLLTISDIRSNLSYIFVGIRIEVRERELYKFEQMMNPVFLMIPDLRLNFSYIL